MSLINQMLKDLEKRQQKQAAKAPADLFVDLNSPNEPVSILERPFFVVISLLLLVSTLCLLMWQYDFFKLPSEQPLVRQKALPLKTKQQAIVTSIPVEDTVQLNEIVTFQKNDHLQLDFRFSGNARYAITEEKVLNRYFLTLSNVEKKENFQEITDKSGFIKSMRISQREEGLRIEFVVTDGTSLNALSQKGNDIVLKFVNPKVVKEPDSVINKNKEVKKIFQPLTQEQKAHRSYRKSLELAEQGKRFEAEKLLQQLVKKYPRFKLARESLVTFLLDDKDYQKAVILLEKTLKIMPHSSKYARIYAQILLARGQADEALKILLKAAPPLTRDPQYYAVVAAAYKNTGQVLQAASVYTTLLKIQPNNSLWWMGLGICSERLHKNNEAISAYQKALMLGNLQTFLRTYVDSRIVYLKG